MFKNLRLQTYLQILNTIIPLITTPYIARVLGAEQLGIFTYTTSIASYFTLCAMFGTPSYGTRTIAMERSEEGKRQAFWEIYSLQLITVLLSSLFYGGYLLFCKENRLMAVLQLITLFGYLFDVSWYFFGTEDFQSAVLLNAFYRILMLGSIFLFVKNQGDLWIYTIIMLGLVAINQISLWLLLIKKRKLGFCKVSWTGIRKHLKPNFLLFIPLVAMTIYHSMDKTMLGMFSTYEQAGYYYNVDKIINVPLGIFTGVSTVLLPRMTILFSDDENKAISFLNESLSVIMMLGVAMCFGLIAVSHVFVPLFLGPGYDECIFLVNAFAPILVVKCVSNAIRTQLLIPAKQESVYIRAIAWGSGVNIVANYLLIPKYGAAGAEIATILSEVIALGIQIAYSLKSIHLSSLLLDGLAYCGIGAIMLMAVRRINLFPASAILQVSVMILTGIIVYGIVCAAYWYLSKKTFFLAFLQRRKKLC